MQWMFFALHPPVSRRLRMSCLVAALAPLLAACGGAAGGPGNDALATTPDEEPTVLALPGAATRVDYRIDHVDPETGIHLTGLKCDGMAGQWTLTFSGRFDDIMRVQGESLIALDGDGRGSFVTETRTVVAEEAQGLIAIPPAHTRGHARMSADGSQLLLQPADSDAQVQWAGAVYQATPTRVETIPLQAGNHCSGVQPRRGRGNGTPP